MSDSQVLTQPIDSQVWKFKVMCALFGLIIAFCSCYFLMGVIEKNSCNCPESHQESAKPADVQKTVEVTTAKKTAQTQNLNTGTSVASSKGDILEDAIKQVVHKWVERDTYFKTPEEHADALINELNTLINAKK